MAGSGFGAAAAGAGAGAGFEAAADDVAVETVIDAMVNGIRTP